MLAVLAAYTVHVGANLMPEGLNSEALRTWLKPNGTTLILTIWGTTAPHANVWLHR